MKDISGEQVLQNNRQRFLHKVSESTSSKLSSFVWAFDYKDEKSN